MTTDYLQYVGELAHPSINDGAPIPLYEMIAPKGGCSINTQEGWNRAADRANRYAFNAAHGRTPESVDELYSWVAQMVSS